DTIDHVTFFANGSAVGTVTTPVAGVYSFNWGSVAAGNYTLTATATDNHGLTGAMSNAAHITVNSASSTLPTPWAAQDIGSGGAVGSASALNGAFTVRGAGDDIWGTADAFQFVYQPMTGDGTLVARVTGIQFTSAWAKAGLMIRQDLTAGAVN